MIQRTSSVLLASVLALAIGGCNKSKDDSTASESSSTTHASLAGGPAQTEAELGQVLASINGVDITVGEFQERINRQSPYVRARYTSTEQKREFLDNLIRFEVLAQEAKRKGLDKDPDVVRTMKQVMIQKLMKDQFENSISPDDISEADMKAYYDDNTAEYNKPEEVRVSAIILDKKASADKVAKEAHGEAGSSNKGFRELVAKYSIDNDTKIRGGDLRYFTADNTELPVAVVKAAFELQRTGDVAGPIHGEDGRFYIIKQTGHRKAVAKTFEQVKRQIQNRLYRERRTKSQKDFVEGLKKAAKIEVNDGNLEKVQIDTSAATTGPHADPHLPATMPGAPNVPMHGDMKMGGGH
jgi:peptidyl-prolyl cis-trans isomerase C